LELVRRLDTFIAMHRAIQDHIRGLIWWFYSDLDAYRTDPTPRRRTELRARFDRIFRRSAGVNKRGTGTTVIVRSTALIMRRKIA
jgi:hypothetical protein